MDKDRIKGSAQEAQGKVKEVAGKVTGDANLESEGKADKTAGKVRNAFGGLKQASDFASDVSRKAGKPSHLPLSFCWASQAQHQFRGV
jgi:uncharacterized protein YjbJ (UPF0337 family)